MGSHWMVRITVSGIILPLLLVAPAEAGARRSCGIGDATRLLATHKVIVWQTGDEDAYRLYGCWRKSGRRTVLRAGAGPYDNPDIGLVRAAGGRVVVTTRDATSTTGDYDTMLYAADLKRRHAHARGVLLFRTTSSDAYRGVVTALALDKSGALGLIIQYVVPPSDPTADRTIERVVARPRHGDQRTVAQAADIDPTRLELRAGSLVWDQAGNERSAPLE